jgi:hypothetical protein
MLAEAVKHRAEWDAEYKTTDAKIPFSVFAASYERNADKWMLRPYSVRYGLNQNAVFQTYADQRKYERFRKKLKKDEKKREKQEQKETEWKKSAELLNEIAKECDPSEQAGKAEKSPTKTDVKAPIYVNPNFIPPPTKPKQTQSGPNGAKQTAGGGKRVFIQRNTEIVEITPHGPVYTGYTVPNVCSQCKFYLFQGKACQRWMKPVNPNQPICDWLKCENVKDYLEIVPGFKIADPAQRPAPLGTVTIGG